MNYSGKLNLLKFRNACIVSVAGRTATKKGVFIPIDDNNLFISVDENLRSKGAYIDFIAWENQQAGKYGDTHSLRQSLSKEVRERMTEDEQKLIPFIGNMKPYELQNAAANANAPVVEVYSEDDLPF